MKNYYLFYFFMATIAMKAQTNCDDANSYLVNAYSGKNAGRGHYLKENRELGKILLK